MIISDLLVPISVFVFLLAVLFTIRFFWVLPGRKRGRTVPKSRNRHIKVMIVLGSGGHTAEMFRLLETLNLEKYPYRIYVTAETDKGVNSSADKAVTFENELRNRAYIKTIPRSREVGQSYITSVFTTLKSFISCLQLVKRELPDLILCNGPGTCVPICFSAFLLKHSKIVYAESFACVSHLSLTAKILYPIVDRFFVQWDTFLASYTKAEYIGRLDNSQAQPIKQHNSGSGYVLVTVGSTRFDELIKEVDRPHFVSTLKSLGYKGLHIQYGHGEYIPVSKSGPDFEIVAFDFKSNLQKEISDSSLVISHAGAGSILEALSSGKPLVVVPNTRLMNNHQMELALELGKKGFLYYTTLGKRTDSENSNLEQLLQMDVTSVVPFPSKESTRFRDIMNIEMGFEPDDEIPKRLEKHVDMKK